jgi:hypothetical protein
MAWSGVRNGDLLGRAAREFDVFLTVDKSIEFQQNLPTELAIVTLLARSNRLEALRPLMPDTLAARAAVHRGDVLRIG